MSDDNVSVQGLVRDRQQLQSALDKPLRETILAVLNQMPSEAAPEHLAAQIEGQVRAWQQLNLSLGADPHVACSTDSCPQPAERYVTCEGEGPYPYCARCAEVLTGPHSREDDMGPVADPVAELADRLHTTLRQIAELDGPGAELARAAIGPQGAGEVER